MRIAAFQFSLSQFPFAFSVFPHYYFLHWFLSKVVARFCPSLCHCFEFTHAGRLILDFFFFFIPRDIIAKGEEIAVSRAGDLAPAACIKKFVAPRRFFYLPPRFGLFPQSSRTLLHVLLYFTTSRFLLSSVPFFFFFFWTRSNFFTSVLPSIRRHMTHLYAPTHGSVSCGTSCRVFIAFAWEEAFQRSLQSCNYVDTLLVPFFSFSKLSCRFHLRL